SSTKASIPDQGHNLPIYRPPLRGQFPSSQAFPQRPRRPPAARSATGEAEPCRTPIARVLDYRDLDIGRVAENPQVRPGIQSTTTGDLRQGRLSLSLTP